MLVYDLRGSGVVQNALRIARAARESGLDVSLWPMRRQGDLLGAVPDDVPVRPLHGLATSRSRDLDSLFSVKALTRAIDHHRPEILFSCGNHTHLHAALALRQVAPRDRIRFLGRASNAIVSAPGQRGRWRGLIRPVERFQYAAMDRLIAVSGELARDLATLGIAPERIETIPNGIDLGAIEAAATAPMLHPFFAEDGPPVVLGIGRLSRQKNFEGLMRAFAVARAQRPLRLMILGPGSESRVARLQRLAARLGIARDFALEGFVANPFPYLAGASLFVLNSRWEGASNVLIEALACGCPVVATRAPTGIAEVLIEGRLGPLVAVGDDDALAEAILDRLAQPRGSAALRQRAADYDLGRTLSAYVRLLESELGQD